MPQSIDLECGQSPEDNSPRHASANVPGSDVAPVEEVASSGFRNSEGRTGFLLVMGRPETDSVRGGRIGYRGVPARY
jgi:hypothetical protein